jgi:hypothetical protein
VFTEVHVDRSPRGSLSCEVQWPGPPSRRLRPAATPASLHGWRYERVEVLRPPATVAPLITPDRSIAVADLLP